VFLVGWMMKKHRIVAFISFIFIILFAIYNFIHTLNTHSLSFLFFLNILNTIIIVALFYRFLIVRKININTMKNYARKEDIFTNIFENVENGIAVYDVQENGNKFVFKDINKSSERIDGVKRELIIGRDVTEVFPGVEEFGLLDIFKEVYKTGKPKHHPATLYKDERLLVWKENYVMKLKTGEIVAVYKDITDRKRDEEEIKYLLFHDKLTGLYNRRYFEEEMKRMNTNRVKDIGIIMGDINGLKLTNDCFGHDAGDKLLQDVADIIKNTCRQGDIVARLGGDEFVIILPDAGKKTVYELCRRITEACKNAPDNPIKPSIALGCATKNSKEIMLEHVLKEAEDRMYRHKLLESTSVRGDIITSLGRTLFEKGYENQEHVRRMQFLAGKLSPELGLMSDETDELMLLCMLHDIGKISINDSVIFKEGTLTKHEWKEIKKHPETGYRIAKASNKIDHIADYILSHHERWDGLGYPQGLSGNDIPKIDRVFAVIEAYDIMTTWAVYKDEISSKEAILELEKNAGTQFDPYVVQVFCDVIGRVKIIKS
jgi:diguanylate cyclase (GGDEF)-like protein/PAS domain S-box-containing protein